MNVDFELLETHPFVMVVRITDFYTESQWKVRHDRYFKYYHCSEDTEEMRNQCIEDAKISFNDKEEHLIYELRVLKYNKHS